MNFKVFVAAFSILLTVQASNQSPTVGDDSIKELVLEIFTKVLDSLAAILADLNARLADFDENQAEYKEKIVADIVALGKELNAKLLEVLTKLKDGATDEGKAVLDCIIAEQDKTDAAFEKTATEVGNCVAGEVPIIITALKDLLTQLGTLKDDVQVPVDALKACVLTEAECLLLFATDEYAVLQKIPPVITEDLQKLKDLIDTIVSDTSGCATDAFNGVLASIQEIFNEAVVCIKK